MLNRDATNVEIGKALRKARKERKLTQEQVSNMTGITRSVLTRYELGQIEISMPNFMLICEAIGVNYSDVLRGVEVINY